MSATIPLTFAGAQSRSRDDLVRALTRLREINISALIARALESAREAGAEHVDVYYRVRHHERLILADGFPTSRSELYAGLGVRVLYNGYWGYAARVGVPNIDEATRLGREATEQTKTSAKGRPRTVDLAPRPLVVNGTWVSPHIVDPFTVSWDEKHDVMKGLNAYMSSVPTDAFGMTHDLQFTKDEGTFAASDGASFQQTLYKASLDSGAAVVPRWRIELDGRRSGGDFINRAHAGWEYVTGVPTILEAQADRLIRQAKDQRSRQPVDVGRYDIVMDGEAFSQIISQTIAPATELDRAMGYTANTIGTSFINDPLAMVGTFQMGSSLLNVTANRSMPTGVATVKWDEEGVEPDEFTLVKEGILTDFQTTRESASWLAPYYAKVKKPVRSHGGAIPSDWWLNRPPTQGGHNLVVSHANADTSFEDLCSGVKKGLAIFGGRSASDQQSLNVETYPELVYEITNGKLGRVIGDGPNGGGAVLYSRSPEFWKNLVGLGGASTVRQVASGSARGDRTIAAPAGLVKGVAVTTDIRSRGLGA